MHYIPHITIDHILLLLHTVYYYRSYTTHCNTVTTVTVHSVHCTLLGLFVWIYRSGRYIYDS